MTWKSYAAVSGATVLAGWLASAPPSDTPGAATAVSRQPVSRPSAASSDIVREAERLQIRVRREVQYAQPRRNPFRFGEPPADADRRSPAPAPAPAEPIVAVPPPPPPVTLSGIAEDQLPQGIERTAILSSPEGVLLVHEGDAVAGEYRVGRIEGEAVELVKNDGTIMRLTLSNPKSQIPNPNSQ